MYGMLLMIVQWTMTHFNSNTSVDAPLHKDHRNALTLLLRNMKSFIQFNTNKPL